MHSRFAPVLVLAAATFLAACQPAAENTEEIADASSANSASTNNYESLATVLAAQPTEVVARYQYRHPQETLEFFELQPGMTVLEALPGGGWYSKLLLSYLGTDGKLIGADYAQEMWPKFSWASEEFVQERTTWIADWTAKAATWGNSDSAHIEAFKLGSMPDEHIATADRVLFIRALHNLARFEDDGGYLSKALADAYAALKPGGLLGVVQHQAADTMSDAFADGSRGYLKKAFVIEKLEQSGFEYLGGLGINHNHNDQPSEDDIVWRLPPTFDGAEEGSALREELTAVGESNRMTLKFRKPE